MMKAIIRKGRIYYHDSLSFHVKEEGIIVPLSLVLHVLEQEEPSPMLLATLPPRPSLRGLTLSVARRGTPSTVKECV